MASDRKNKFQKYGLNQKRAAMQSAQHEKKGCEKCSRFEERGGSVEEKGKASRL